MTAPRLRFAQEPVAPSERDLGAARPVTVIGSGKGGVGKSIVATLMAQALARAGRRVLLVDGSQNLGHLHAMLGVSADNRLEQLHRGEIGPAALIRAVDERLSLLVSDSGAEGLYGLAAIDQARLHQRLASVYDEFDEVVVDAGPGLETVVRLATFGGTRLVVVTIPEIAALADGYALIKLVHAQLPSLPIGVLVNRAADLGEARRTFDRLATAATRFLRHRLEYCGGLLEVPRLKQAMRDPGALLTDPELIPLRDAVAAVTKGPPMPAGA